VQVGSLHLPAQAEKGFKLVALGTKGVEFEGLFLGGGEDFGGEFHVDGYGIISGRGDCILEQGIGRRLVLDEGGRTARVECKYCITADPNITVVRLDTIQRIVRDFELLCSG
jgi:hypothetical protein